MSNVALTEPLVGVSCNDGESILVVEEKEGMEKGKEVCSE